MLSKEYTMRAKQLQEFLGAGAQRAGQESGFVQRASKLSAAVFVQTLVLGLSGTPTASLSELAEYSQQLGVAISGQGLHERLNGRAVKFLQMMFEQALRFFQN